MKRRDLIEGMAASALPFVARAQEKMRRIGVLMHAASDTAEAQDRLAAFLQGLRDAGWTVGQNIRVDARWSAGDIPQLFRDAAALATSNPDVILAGIGATTQALQQATRTIPIVFAQGLDPVGNSYVESLARPGGNTTGFVQLDYGLAGKWLELLNELAPEARRVAMLREAGPAGIGQWAILQAVAQSIGVEIKPIDLLREAAAIERDVAAFASVPNSGLVVAVSASGLTHRDLIVALAARHRLPAVYAYRVFVTGGGLASYGTDIAALYRRAAGYVDRILKGEKPADLPVQTPTKYDLVINLKTAKALGLNVPLILQQRADEVIE
jgi:putative ABC transport system substrate-binding protein